MMNDQTLIVCLCDASLSQRLQKNAELHKMSELENIQRKGIQKCEKWSCQSIDKVAAST